LFFGWGGVGSGGGTKVGRGDVLPMFGLEGPLGGGENPFVDGGGNHLSGEGENHREKKNIRRSNRVWTKGLQLIGGTGKKIWGVRKLTTGKGPKQKTNEPVR